MTSLADFYDALDRHDWFYDYSDDHNVWNRGQAERSRLTAISRESQEHSSLFDSMKSWHMTISGPKAPKPERPT